MIQTIYFIILTYFILGAIGFYVINRKKARDVARQSWTKFGFYFLIIHILFFSIVLNSIVFSYLSVLIVGVSMYELFNLFYKSRYQKKSSFVYSFLIFGVVASGFIYFSTLAWELILFTFLILSIFDSFSQISGQLFGHRKIFPSISPNKTYGGLIGGSVIAILSALLLQGLYPEVWYKQLIMAGGIVFFSFFGDLGASYYKRIYGVKDYSRLIPGNGGFLDRFDSLIAAGLWVAFVQLIIF